ncbi:hypothetical protein [uncultured Mediterranean phage uvMED]|nr:hypothetical protein [uncultured Mediterranean phage uvMED]
MTEEALFNYLKEHVYPDLEKTSKHNSKWDCFSPLTRHRIELKCRRKHYPTLLLEKKKYDSLIEKTKGIEKPIYINSTPEGIFAFKLDEIEMTWEVNHKNPAKTYWGSGARVPKEVTYLELSKGKTL